MTSHRVLIDTGPIVALLNRNDVHHERCGAAMRQFAFPPLTCWPIITEAAWMLRHDTRNVQHLMDTITHQVFRLADLAAEDMPNVSAILAKYASARMQFADACLMAVAEREKISTIFTTDRRDFSLFRFRNGRPPRLVPEP